MDKVLDCLDENYKPSDRKFEIDGMLERFLGAAREEMEDFGAYFVIRTLVRMLLASGEKDLLPKLAKEFNYTLSEGE